jgi:hypothetical protein
LAGDEAGLFADYGSLLEQSFESPPSASDGRVALFQSPHQNNFQMAIEVQVWSARPPLDADDWQQVSTEEVVVDERQTLHIGSPTMEGVEVTVPEGTYQAEASGRGFVNHGWPGSTEPGDEWRIRLWPAEAPGELVRKSWESPFAEGAPAEADEEFALFVVPGTWDDVESMASPGITVEQVVEELGEIQWFEDRARYRIHFFDFGQEELDPSNPPDFWVERTEDVTSSAYDDVLAYATVTAGAGGTFDIALIVDDAERGRGLVWLRKSEWS